MKQEDYSYIDGLICKYLSGEIDSAELMQLKSWAAESQENKNYVREKVEIGFSAAVSSDNTAFDEVAAYERFKQRISFRKQFNFFNLKIANRLARIAAVLLLVILPLAAYYKGKDSVKQEFAEIVIEAPMGARTKMHLPDGTAVWLNAGSKLSYSQGFGIDNRDVQLEGESYFEVNRNENLPFCVKTKEVKVRVLGTKFNFRNYQDDNEAVVNLLEGKVSLMNGLRKMSEQYLAPGECMTLDKHTGMMTLSKAKVENSVVWMNNELFFDEELLSDVAKKLSRCYNVTIELADSLRDRRFYGSFTIVGNTVDEVLHKMASTNQMRYSVKDKKYIIY